MAPDETTALYLLFFNEIGIISQLASTIVYARLPDGLLDPHFAILSHLTRVGDGRALHDMAAAFQVPRTTMSHRVRVLHEHGLVRVEAHAKDRRSKTVWLTDEGRAMRAEFIEGFADLAERWSADIPPATVAAMTPELERIRAFLDADCDTP